MATILTTIVAPSAKLTMYFKNADGYGWSENFYYNGSLSNPAFTSNVSQLVSARASILTNTCNITHLRVASSLSRAPYVFSLNPGGTVGTEMPPTAEEEVALLVRLVSGVSPRYNRHFMRGIPARVTNVDEYTPDLTFINEFNNFVAVITNGLWNIHSLIASVPNPKIPCTLLGPTPPRGIVTTLNTAGPVVGNVVRIRGAIVPGYNGLKTVTAVSSSGLIITMGGASPAATDTGMNATVQVQQLFDETIGNMFVESLSRRAGGRPFGLSRGRKPTLYSLRR